MIGLFYEKIIFNEIVKVYNLWKYNNREMLKSKVYNIFIGKRLSKMFNFLKIYMYIYLYRQKNFMEVDVYNCIKVNVLILDNVEYMYLFFLDDIYIGYELGF